MITSCMLVYFIAALNVQTRHYSIYCLFLPYKGSVSHADHDRYIIEVLILKLMFNLIRKFVKIIRTFVSKRHNK